jgi:hypothetical protein|tara:strand:+ start:139 stop:603 length:465 start_codon:yes stop_codon:yes gene_type:complete
MAIVVRNPSLEDFKQINDLGKWFQENSDYKGCGWSDGKFYGLVKDATNPLSDTFMLVADDGGEVVGLFLGCVTECFFSYEKVAKDLGLVFKPDRRKGIVRAVIEMISSYKLWAIEKGVNQVTLGITSGIAGAGYKKLLERHGFKEAGVLLKIEV